MPDPKKTFSTGCYGILARHRLQAIGKALGVGPEQAGLLARAGDEMAADPRRERLLAALSEK